MKDIPLRIFMQAGPGVDDETSFKELDQSQVTWATQRVFVNDLEYISADGLLETLEVIDASLRNDIAKARMLRKKQVLREKRNMLLSLQRMILGQRREEQRKITNQNNKDK